ncbi:MAG: methyltransferase [Gemmatimonadota bacterium]
MNRESASAPLMLVVQLTEEQRRMIREQTGQDITALPYETKAPSVRCEFGGVRLRVVRGVFVPVAATEQVLQATLCATAGQRNPIIAEVGTGSGAVALAAAKAMPGATVFASDISRAALACARRNRARNGLRNVHFQHGSLLSSLPARLRGRVSVVVGNLPYLPPRLTAALASSFPPDTAIGIDEDGLGLPRQLAAAAREFLQPGGSLVLQLAGFQWPEFIPELTALGYDEPVLSSTASNAPVAGLVHY